MITFSISAIRGPMLLMVSGLLGESSFGNGSHFSRCAQHRYSQGFVELPRNCNAEKLRSLLGEWLTGYGLGQGGRCELIEITCPNGPKGGMRPSPCDDAIMFGPKAQKEGRGIFGRTNVKENVLETTEKIDSY